MELDKGERWFPMDRINGEAWQAGVEDVAEGTALLAVIC